MSYISVGGDLCPCLLGRSVYVVIGIDVLHGWIWRHQSWLIVFRDAHGLCVGRFCSLAQWVRVLFGQVMPG